VSALRASPRAPRLALAARRLALAAAVAVTPTGAAGVQASGVQAAAAQPAPEARGEQREHRGRDARPPAEAYAVVVHPATSVSEVSLDQLRRVFLGEQQFWSGGSRVVLFVQAPGTHARSVMLRRLYRMDETEFKRYWIAKTFRNDVAFGPKIVSSSALARRLTATIPGAVSVIPLSAVDASVRVLRVDGRLPDDDGYPITGGE
jgi:phosphate transport system substrate-binding protein